MDAARLPGQIASITVNKAVFQYAVRHRLIAAYSGVGWCALSRSVQVAMNSNRCQWELSYPWWLYEWWGKVFFGL